MIKIRAPCVAGEKADKPHQVALGGSRAKPGRTLDEVSSQGRIEKKQVNGLRNLPTYAETLCGL